MNSAAAGCIYIAIKGNHYALNAIKFFIPVMAVVSFLGYLGSIALKGKKLKIPPFMKSADLIYDVAITGILATTGFFTLAAFYFVQMFFIQVITEEEK